MTMAGAEVAELADEWEARAKNDAEWSPGEPRGGESPTITIRLRPEMLEVVKAIAARRSLRYQTLIKMWLDEKIREERDRVAGRTTVTPVALAVLEAIGAMRAEVASLGATLKRRLAGRDDRNTKKKAAPAPRSRKAKKRTTQGLSAHP